MALKAPINWNNRSINGTNITPTVPAIASQIVLADANQQMTIDPLTITIIAGSTDSGKTNLLRNIIRMQALGRKFHRCIIFCPTALNQKSNPYGFVKKENVIVSPSEEMLEAIIKQQDESPNLITALVFDDCLGAMSFKTDLWTRLACGSRHKRLSIFILAQDLGKVPSILKDNATTLFVNKIKRHTLKHAFDMQQGFKKVSEFESYIDDNVGKDKNYQVLRLNILASSSLTHALFRPPICRNFTLT